MTDRPEFSRIWRLDELGDAPRDVTLEADPAECAALAARFDLIAVDRLEAEATVAATGTTVTAEGRVSAAVVQRCVVSGDPVAARIDAPFTLRFVSGSHPEAGAEIELSEADCDTIDYEGAAVDLGEAVAETMALALDPFPRSPAADRALKEAGVAADGPGGAFAGLKALLGKS